MVRERQRLPRKRGNRLKTSLLHVVADIFIVLLVFGDLRINCIEMHAGLTRNLNDARKLSGIKFTYIDNSQWETNRNNSSLNL
jgi:hypothetical protein